VRSAQAGASSRQGKRERSIRIAFLAPRIVKATIGGHLPRGYGLKPLLDLPMGWAAPMAGARTRAADPGEKIITFSLVMRSGADWLIFHRSNIEVRIAGNETANDAFT
jgi:hypothetical protein